MATKQKAERFSVTELDRLRLCVMHARVYVKDDAKVDKMLDKLQAKIEGFIVGRGRTLQDV